MKTLYLTFDDGPSKEHTPRLLDLLKEQGIQATFFVVGVFARENPDIICRELAEGHDLALHSNTHFPAYLMSRRMYEKDMDASIENLKYAIAEGEADTERIAAVGRTIAAAEESTIARIDAAERRADADKIAPAYRNYTPRLYRAPWGRTKSYGPSVAAKRGLETIRWDVMAQDWRASISIDEIEKRILERVFDGAVICLHDGRGRRNAPARTIAALEKALPKLKERGYRFEKL